MASLQLVLGGNPGRNLKQLPRLNKWIDDAKSRISSSKTKMGSHPLSCRASSAQNLKASETASVAERALAVIGGDDNVSPYYLGWHEAQTNAFDEQTNPDGCIQLGLAENKLSLDLLEHWFSTHDTAPAPEFESILNFRAISGYPDVYHGLLIFRELMANFMDDLFGGGVRFDPEHMVITAGATAAIEMAAFCIADPCEVFLVPAPYYSGFDRDIKFRSQVKLVPVPSYRESNFLMTRAALDQAFEDSENGGNKVRAILMTSPSNPLGVTYEEEYLLMILHFVSEKGIHLISDEIYAGSVFGDSKFVSFVELATTASFNPSRIHIVYGLSKVLGIPGFRVGLLYSWNKQVLAAAKNLARFSSVPTLTQQTLVSLLSDSEFLRSYSSENRRRLAQRWLVVRHGLQEAGIEFVDCTGGFFCWVNLGHLLPRGSTEQELELWNELLYDGGINITPGSACHCAEPGWFRLCFAFVDDHTIAIALDRIKNFTSARKKMKKST